MKTLSLGLFGIDIKWNGECKDGAAIVSKMNDDSLEDNRVFGVAVDVLESTILAHFCAGVDVSTDSYIEGIKTAYTTLCDHYIDAEIDVPTDVPVPNSTYEIPWFKKGKIENMTVDNFQEIVQTHLCIYGDQSLFVYENDFKEPFYLFAGEDKVLECLSYFEAGNKGSNLLDLADRLEGLDGALKIRCESENVQVGDFRIVFITPSDGFVEMLNSKELSEQVASVS